MYTPTPAMMEDQSAKTYQSPGKLPGTAQKFAPNIKIVHDDFWNKSKHQQLNSPSERRISHTKNKKELNV